MAATHQSPPWFAEDDVKQTPRFGVPTTNEKKDSMAATFSEWLRYRTYMTLSRIALSAGVWLTRRARQFVGWSGRFTDAAIKEA